MTLTEITTEVRNITGVDSTSVVSDAVIHDLINEAQYQLCDEANLLQGYATRNSVVDTREYFMKDTTNTPVTDWTLVQNNRMGATNTSESLEFMTRIYRVDYDGAICQRIGINEINFGCFVAVAIAELRLARLPGCVIEVSRSPKDSLIGAVIEVFPSCPTA